MPELPEVEVVRHGLEPAVSGARIAQIEVFEPRSLRRHVAGPLDFVDRLQSKTLLAAVRRGKFLWFPLGDAEQPLGNGEALIAHLGMSGQLLLRDRQASLDRLTRIRIRIEHPTQGDLAIHFVDQRIFGSLAVDILEPLETSGGYGGKRTAAELSMILNSVPTQVRHIARDALDPLFDDEHFVQRLLAKRTEIKRALLDQELISGIGNIYADEALWRAGLHYQHSTATLSRTEALSLLEELRLVLRKALHEGGTSFDAQYVNVNGESGYFAHSLNAYGQQGKPCSRCGELIVRESFMNRGSHFCPNCQSAR